ncbi:MAG TPA: 6-phospho-3-hexuloisomerase [Candidatus Thermoplasmatota archaeon]|nr:6-phospho-3-hexuloisomerase [Candidatus Thermoplasmatota archaeon]
MKLREAAHYILNQMRASVDDVPDDQVRRLVEMIEKAKSVVIFGRGRSGLVGRALAIRLQHLGIPSYVVGETITPPVHEDDLVILISGSGETFSVTVTGQIAKKLGCKIVSVTGHAGSTLGKMGDLTIVLRTSSSGRQKELAPLGTLFEDACQVFFDGLTAELMERRGATEESMRARHATLE